MRSAAQAHAQNCSLKRAIGSYSPYNIFDSPKRAKTRANTCIASASPARLCVETCIVAGRSCGNAREATSHAAPCMAEYIAKHGLAAALDRAVNKVLHMSPLPDDPIHELANQLRVTDKPDQSAAPAPEAIGDEEGEKITPGMVRRRRSENYRVANTSTTPIPQFIRTRHQRHPSWTQDYCRNRVTPCQTRRESRVS